MTYIDKLFWSKFNLPLRIYRKLWKLFAKYSGYSRISSLDQSRIFEEIGLNREDGLIKLNNILMKYFGTYYDENDGMYSEHLITLASISCINQSINNILEIGTYDGRTALILSKLFANADVLTIDLPLSDSMFETTYARKGKVNDFVKYRDKNLQESKQIRFLETNSINLTNSEEKFDLIWIDGAHGYPVVAMDIINSYRLSKEEGYVLIDDVWKKVDYSDKYYKSIAAYESLSELQNAKMISNFYLIPKRLGGKFNLSWEKKYVGVFQRPKSIPSL